MKRSDKRGILSQANEEIELFDDRGIEWLPDYLSRDVNYETASNGDIGDSYPCGSDSCFECSL